MCTLVILRRPNHSWPLILAANRDEMADRPWAPPARHWPDRADIVAGRDELAGGTWMGINDSGVISAVLNRRNSLGPQADRRSRGELPLEALDHETAAKAVKALAYIDPASYRSFNLFIADSDNAFLLYSRNDNATPAPVEVQEIPTGVSMITASDLNDSTSARIRKHLPRFRSAPGPTPEADDWFAWQALLGSRKRDADAGPEGAMNIVTDGVFGTVCSSLIAIPQKGDPDHRPVWLFAAGRPDEAPFLPVDI